MFDEYSSNELYSLYKSFRAVQIDCKRLQQVDNNIYREIHKRKLKESSQ